MSADKITLYSGPLSMFGMKAEIALQEKGIPFDLVMVPFDMAKLYEPKHPLVERVNPKRQVPILVHGALEIFDSTQIFEYLEDLAPQPRLWPADRTTRAEARQLELKSDEVYFPNIIRLFSLQQKLDTWEAIAAITGASAIYAEFETSIADKPFLAGDYSYADIAFYMAQLYGARMSAPMTDAHPRLKAWRERVGERGAVQTVMNRLVPFLRSHNRPIPDFMARFG